MKLQRPWIGVVLCFFAGMGVVRGLTPREIVSPAPVERPETPPPANTLAWSDEGAVVPVDSNDAVWGSRTAPVTFVVFGDFECPHCKDLEPILERLRQRYGPDVLRIVYKNDPLALHPHAFAAAVAGNAAHRLGGTDAYWIWHKEAFAHQDKLDEAHFVAWAVLAGLDPVKYRAALTEEENAVHVQIDQETAESLKVRGTPTVFVNGLVIGGVKSPDRYESLVEREVIATGPLVRSLPPDRVYVAISRQNQSFDGGKDRDPDDDIDGPESAEAIRLPTEDTSIYRVALKPTDIVTGPADALVTIVLYSDFQCPFSAGAQKQLKALVSENPGKIRLVSRQRPLPIHPRAVAAATFALEARAEKGEKGYFAAFDTMFEHSLVALQKQEVSYRLSDDDIASYAREIGVDPAKVKHAIETSAFDEAIEIDSDSADDLGATGTPTFFLNGRKVIGPESDENLKKAFAEELARAEALVSSGTPRAQVYEKLIADGREIPLPEKKPVPQPLADVPWKGGEKAKVIIDVFSDFQCPYCRQAESGLTRAEKTFGTAIKIRWRDRPLPNHPDAPLAAEAGLEIFKQKKSEGFWKFHDFLLATESKSPDGIKRAGLASAARDAGADLKLFEKALENHTHRGELDQEVRAADGASINATPSFVVSAVGQERGYFMSGMVPYSRLRRVIRSLLREPSR